MALVLLMEGVNQFISWRHITEFINNTFNPVLRANDDTVLSVLNDTITNVLNNPLLPVTQKEFDGVSEEFALSRMLIQRRRKQNRSWRRFTLSF